MISSYSFEEGWKEGETDDPFAEWLIEYGFAQEPIPGVGLIRQFQDFKPRRIVGNTLFALGAGTAWTYGLSGQGYRSMSGIAYEALTGGRFAPAPLIPVVVAAGGTAAFVEFHKTQQPSEPTHQPSWWNSLAAAMAGTFGGMNYE